jgi:hypothetical protein
MALLLIVALVLVLIGAGVRSRRFTRPPAEPGRWWDQPAATVREPYEQGDR